MLETNKQASNNHNGKKKIDPKKEFGSIFSFVSRMQFVECIFIISSTEHRRMKRKNNWIQATTTTTGKKFVLFFGYYSVGIQWNQKKPGISLLMEKKEKCLFVMTFMMMMMISFGWKKKTIIMESITWKQ